MKKMKNKARIRTRQNMMHLKPEPVAGASSRLRPISATRQKPIGHIFSLVLLILMGLLCMGAGHAPEMYNNGQGTAGRTTGTKEVLI